MEIQKFEYLENEKSFLDDIRSIFHNFLGLSPSKKKKEKKKKKQGSLALNEKKIPSQIFSKIFA